MKINKIIVWIALIFCILLSLFPIYWIVKTSFQEIQEAIMGSGAFYPKNPTFSAYIIALFEKPTFSSLKDSLIISTCTTLLSMLLGTIAGYAFSRFRVPGGDNLAFWILSLRMFPPIAVIIPLFFLYKWINILDTYLCLILTYLTFNLPLSTWLMMGFFNDIPRSLEEAAYVDGYSTFQALRKVTIPLIYPGFVATTILCWIFAWNEFLFAVILTGVNINPIMRLIPTVAVGAADILAYPVFSAMSLIAAIPAVIVTVALRKHLVRGLSLGTVRLE